MFAKIEENFNRITASDNVKLGELPLLFKYANFKEKFIFFHHIQLQKSLKQIH